MVHYIKNRLAYSLFFSTLALAGCGRTGNTHQGPNKEAQTLIENIQNNPNGALSLDIPNKFNVKDVNKVFTALCNKSNLHTLTFTDKRENILTFFAHTNTKQINALSNKGITLKNLAAILGSPKVICGPLFGTKLHNGRILGWREDKPFCILYNNMEAWEEACKVEKGVKILLRFPHYSIYDACIDYDGSIKSRI